MKMLRSCVAVYLALFIRLASALPSPLNADFVLGLPIGSRDDADALLSGVSFFDVSRCPASYVDAPLCFNKCINDKLAQVSCAKSDLKCMCTGLSALEVLAQPCVSASCHDTDENVKALQMRSDLCECVRSASNGDSSTRATSAPARTTSRSGPPSSTTLPPPPARLSSPPTSSSSKPSNRPAAPATTRTASRATVTVIRSSTPSPPPPARRSSIPPFAVAASATASPEGGGDRFHTPAAVVGYVVGAVAVAAILLFLGLWLSGRRKLGQNAERDDGGSGAAEAATAAAVAAVRDDEEGKIVVHEGELPGLRIEELGGVTRSEVEARGDRLEPNWHLGGEWYEMDGRAASRSSRRTPSPALRELPARMSHGAGLQLTELPVRRSHGAGFQLPEVEAAGATLREDR